MGWFRTSPPRNRFDAGDVSPDPPAPSAPPGRRRREGPWAEFGIDLSELELPEAGDFSGLGLDFDT